MKKQYVLGTVVFVAGMLVSSGVAQTTVETVPPPQGQSTGTSQTGSLSRSDQQFITKAAESNMAELKLAELAQQKASNDDVKEFANRLVQDYQKSNQQLQQIGSRAGVSLPTRMSREQQSTYDRLSQLSGEEFDRAFLREMENSHRRNISEYKQASQTARDPELKQFAMSHVPTLQNQMDKAQQLRRGEAANGQTSRPSNGSRTNGDYENRDGDYTDGTRTDENRPDSW